MAHVTPTIHRADQWRLFVVDPDGSSRAMRVGGPAWYSWLETACLFRYVDHGAGNLTARKEARRYTVAWYAYRKVAGRQFTAYLGQSADLTAERLQQVAQQLTAKTSVPVLDTPGSLPKQGPR